MRSLDPSAAIARVPAWAFALSAIALVGIVVGLVRASVQPLEGTGFEERAYADERCQGEPTRSIVREPFVREERAAAPLCAEWSAFLVVRAKTRAHLELAVEGAAEARLDDRVVVAEPGTTAMRASPGIVDLAPGVHPFAARFRTVAVKDGRGPAYFRVAMVDDLGPRDRDVVPPIDDDAFYPRAEDATRALSSPPRERPWTRALVAGLALVGAGVLLWMASRRRRGLALPLADLAIGAAIFTLALAVRARAIEGQDIAWDEPTYLFAGEHYVRNLIVGDFFPEAWRHNLEHPPNTKWIAGLGALLGGHDGARALASIESSLAAAFLFAFGRVAFRRSVGLVAGALAVALPLWVAHARIVGHESSVLVWWCASMLALACWLRSPPRGPLDGGDPRAAFACVFAATMGLLSRATTIWIFPILLVVSLARSRKALRRGVIALPVAAVAGGLLAAAMTLAVWPFLWHQPFAQFARMAEHWGQPWGDIEVYMGRLTLPAWHYFVVAFALETPALILALGLAGIVIALRSQADRAWGLLCLLWLVVPFAQSVSTLRIGAARYVIQSWPALLLFAAIALVALGEIVADVTMAARPRVRAALRALPAILAVTYTAFALASVEPYPLSYWSELAGGPSGVASRKLFEVPWWGEGNGAAIRHLNATAPPNARVRLRMWPETGIERLRDDLVVVGDAPADRIVLSHLQYVATAPPECTLEKRFEAAGAPLVDVLDCPPRPSAPALAQLGFAAIHRSAIDEAVGHFRDALAVDRDDPSAKFGMGWAYQIKGDAALAEGLYVEAATGAARTGDVETEYFALFDLGTLHEARGDHEKAAQSFRQAIAVIDRAPDRLGSHAANARYNLDRALLAGGAK